MTFNLTQQNKETEFLRWMANKLKGDLSLLNVLEYLDKKYPSDDIYLRDIAEYKEFLIEKLDKLNLPK